MAIKLALTLNHADQFQTVSRFYHLLSHQHPTEPQIPNIGHDQLGYTEVYEYDQKQRNPSHRQNSRRPSVPLHLQTFDRQRELRILCHEYEQPEFLEIVD